MRSYFGFTVKTKPISVNACYSQNKYRRRFMTDEGKAFKNTIGWAAVDAIRDQCYISGTIDFLRGDWRVDIYYFFANAQSDIDGPTKLVLDALQGIFYKKDNQVKEYFCRKSIDKKDPRIEIHVKLLKA